MASIILKDVSVEFPVYNARARSIKTALFNRAVGGIVRGTNAGPVTISALRGISLHLKDGDRFALVGRNGAGKSTLLRVMSGVYEPGQGVAEVRGSVSCLTDIMMGMDLESTGYENIVLRGVFLGLSPNQARRLVPDIEQFTELGEFLQLPMRTYSSGMMLRLAFAITTAVSPDILIMDEMIGAGDASFIQKAKERVDGMIDNASILVLASHDASILQRFCNRAALMQEGQILGLGSVEEILQQYLPIERAHANGAT